MEVENANNGMNAGVTESVTHTQEDSKAPKENGSKNDNEDKKPRRKKRKTSSCDVCRRFKTRCDFDVMYGKCYRCKVLNLECSLTMERQTEINKTQKLGVNALLNNDDSKDLKPMNIDEITMKVRDMDYNYGVLNHKLDLILNMLQKSHNEGRLPSGNDKQGKLVPFTSVYDDIRPSNDGYRIHEPPLKLINDLDARLFPLDALTQKAKMEREQRPSAVARVKFLDFYKKHQELCHQLSKEFLMRSHFWIIPGGIKEIDETYANKHLFITSVFTIIAMSFADNDKYAQQQEELYPLVERLLTNTLTMFEKLTDYDIEAILYCSMFNISRKAKRYRQLKYNSLVLSNFALYSLLNIVDFHRIKERVNAAEFDMKDLYHLRILNSLTACHLEYSISSGQIWEQNSAIKEFNNLVVKFPQANFADDIKVSEINLNVVVNAIFMNFKTYFHRYLYKYSDNSTVQEKQLLLFDELELWLKDWEELLAKDGAGVLLFTYDFYHIMICRSFITDNKDEVSKYPDFLDNVLYTMKEHAFSLLRGFLRLPPSLIKGAPIFTTYELVYACLSLCDYIHLFDQPERQQVLSTCTRVYWHLSTIGEKMNEATDNVGTIIKSIIDTSKQSVSKTQDMATHNNHSSMRDSMASSGSKLQTSPRQHNNTLSDTKSSGMQLPDVDQYNSFEEFFQGFFNNLKPSTQQIFESSKQTK
ncbi:uncharacterized protein GVI51_H01485 [Nakaseomyces glabratus]|uniref:Zn(2)-C6 fungal-type domain-containing protein n=2 Tax=Candida glabrata TaxID=5478 RepID=Q6FSC2_CANGA|nr:uncharacterized protein CAGL0H01683g [Nakaseomyces glabratus]KAH7601294.1 Zn(2)-C6 fungal-type DNA-binding domain profile [Nakaseomyces glabratus]KAH7605678.1 Zn(2)-C6 fungal-type DNA-binding domain profile [Nakaseomyces glabratus]KAI8386165.1 Zn(2)-C6 fungal-type DNA-binding domain profile [Nakaseomyces glabratus]KTA95568.1 Uracil catabolism protein 2 [Nakaseomyces glabratus]KTA98976.1 Uracil catabolism protein 2 [Nakaseomyces glabratus]|eukprot:XP_446872.1 uncharacterized protein CAGL0H01683g [[Candida] glabrata]